MNDYVQAFYDKQEKTLLINDYLEVESLKKANDLLREVALAEDERGQRISDLTKWHGYKLWWMFYKKLLNAYCLPITKYGRLFDELKAAKKVKVYCQDINFNNLASLFLHSQNIPFEFALKIRINSLIQKLSSLLNILVKVFISFVSLVVLSFIRPKVMIMTTDTFCKRGKYEFRLHNIFREILKRKICYAQFIYASDRLKNIFPRFFSRGRPVIYSDSIFDLFCWIDDATAFIMSFFQTKKRKSSLATTISMRINRHNMWSSQLTISVLSFIMKLIGLRSAYLLNNDSRYMHELISAKIAGIKTVGNQHGIETKEYHVNRFMEELETREPNLGHDVYGVWSISFKEDLEKNSKVYFGDKVEVSGLLQYESEWDNVDSIIQDREEFDGKIRVLWISEPLLDVSEAVPYIRFLLKDPNIIVLLKVRPGVKKIKGKLSKDIFLEKLQDKYKDIFSRIKIVDLEMHEAIKQADLAIGSHSTALIELLAQNKPFVLFETKKWGDFFGLDSHNQFSDIYAHSPEELHSYILKKRNNRNSAVSLRKYFLGDKPIDAGKWAVEQLLDY